MTKRLLETLKGNKTDRSPFWFMRQAGRYLPEYQETRAKAGGFLDMVYNPDLAAEVTLQPLRRFDMDGAILFSDILVIPHALGQPLRFEEGRGPVLERISSAEDILPFQAKDIHKTLSPVYETLSLLSGSLSREHPEATLIGFAGAPWTVATYMVEGGGSKTFERVKTWAYDPDRQFHVLMDLLVDATIAYLSRQVKAGAEVLQIFDTWAGVLDEKGFDEWVIKPTRKIVSAVRRKHPEVPLIGFPKGAGERIIRYAKETGVQGVGLDYALDIKTALSIPDTVILQGNLDPIRLMGPEDGLISEAKRIKEAMQDRLHIFNLGHGFQPATPVERVAALSRYLKENA